MPIVHTDAAGIDVGSRFHVVAVGQDKEAVQQFGVTTPDLHQLCGYLQSQGVRRVAMESTAYYWIPLFWMLHSYGFEILVANPLDSTVAHPRPSEGFFPNGRFWPDVTFLRSA